MLRFCKSQIYYFIINAFSIVDFSHSPSLTSLNRLTALFLVIQERIFLGIVQPWPVVLALCVMCLGAFVAAWNDRNGKKF